MQTCIRLVAGVLLWAAASLAWPADNQDFDWDQWRYLPVQDGGRQKPLDTLAWETFRTLANETGLADPESGQWLNAPTLYLVLLFDWQGWDRPASPHAGEASRVPTGYFQRHRPDRWDQAPLLRVDFLALREALGLSKHDKFISPLALSQAKIKLPDATAERPFVHWAEGFTPPTARGADGVRGQGAGTGRQVLDLPGPPHGQAAGLRADPGQRRSAVDLLGGSGGRRMGREIRPDRLDAAGAAAVPGGSHSLPAQFCRGLQSGLRRVSGRHPVNWGRSWVRILPGRRSAWKSPTIVSSRSALPGSRWPWRSRA